jgi:hypothetical protein
MDSTTLPSAEPARSVTNMLTRAVGHVYLVTSQDAEIPHADERSLGYDADTWALHHS